MNRPNFFFLLISAIVLVSCGQDVCIMNVGRCDYYKKVQQEAGGGDGSTDPKAMQCDGLNLTILTTTVPYYSGNEIQFKAEGGRPAGGINGGYSYFVQAPGQTTFVTDPSIDGSNPATIRFVPQTKGRYGVKVTTAGISVNRKCYNNTRYFEVQ